MHPEIQRDDKAPSGAGEGSSRNPPEPVFVTESDEEEEEDDEEDEDWVLTDCDDTSHPTEPVLEAPGAEEDVDCTEVGENVDEVDETYGAKNRCPSSPAREDSLPCFADYYSITADSPPRVYSKELLADPIGSSLRRKRKLDEEPAADEPESSKKLNSTPESVKTEPSSPTSVLVHSTSVLKRPAKCPALSLEHPPEYIQQWVNEFANWDKNAQNLGLQKLLTSVCQSYQLRLARQIIEPHFQRDFISLLPKELALYVLSFLEPRDLLRAAQTCTTWRYLAEDNLLWREKCREAGIEIRPRQLRRIRKEATMHVTEKHRRGHLPSPSAGQVVMSPWKAAYMRQNRIEMNWRTQNVRCVMYLRGHDDHVITCLQFSGNRIVSGSDDNTLKVWSATTGKCLRTLVGHTGGVWSSQMSGSTIISGSTDRTLKIWDADTGACLHTLYGHTSTVRCMHLHGNRVVSGSRDATLRVWDVTTGACLYVLLGHMAAVRCVQYDGKLVVSGAYDYTVKVWNPEREECLHTLSGHTNRVYSLQFDGVHVVSGSLDTSIRVWEVESGALKQTLVGHQSLTSGMELRDNILVSGNADSTVKVWDILTGKCLQTLSGPNKHQSAVTCLQFNKRFVITSSDDGTVKLWDVRTGEFIRNLVTLDSGGSGGVVWRIRASETKLVCAVGSRNGTEETKLVVLDFDVDPSKGHPVYPVVTSSTEEGS